MSRALQPAIQFGEEAIARTSEQSDIRPLARRLCQAMALLPLFSLILLPEYVQGRGDLDAKSTWYLGTVGPMRTIDALLLGVIATHSVVWTILRSTRLHFPRVMATPGLGFLFAILLAMAYGWVHGGTNLFFDWRALALGIGMYMVFALWMRTPTEARSATDVFAGFMAVRIGLIYASFLQGGGDVIMGVRIPIFDGPTLSAVVLTAVLASWMSNSAKGWRQRLPWSFLGASAYLLVLLCFRRTFWMELGIATGLLLLLQKQRRRQRLLFAAAMVAAVAVALGPAFYDRMQSLDFTTSESEFSESNPDHVGEVLDAWEEVKLNPVTGIGLGRSYPTFRIRGWKEESVMVHNAPLHVWLKYGLFGLACYFWFHLELLRWLRQRQKSLSPEDQVWPGVALVYLATQFVVALGFSPWPYSSLQSSILIAFVLAMAIAGTAQCSFRQSPSSLPR